MARGPICGKALQSPVWRLFPPGRVGTSTAGGIWCTLALSKRGPERCSWKVKNTVRGLVSHVLNNHADVYPELVDKLAETHKDTKRMRFENRGSKKGRPIKRNAESLDLPSASSNEPIGIKDGEYAEPHFPEDYFHPVKDYENSDYLNNGPEFALQSEVWKESPLKRDTFEHGHFAAPDSNVEVMYHLPEDDIPYTDVLQCESGIVTVEMFLQALPPSFRDHSRYSYHFLGQSEGMSWRRLRLSDVIHRYQDGRIVARVRA